MPILHLLAGPNGSGKTTYVERVLDLGLPFINADAIAARLWPGEEESRAPEASRAAELERRQLMKAGRSFISETVFSHTSKLELVEDAVAAGYYVHLHVMLVPKDVSVARVPERVARGGHSVPADKIRNRYDRLWPLVASAVPRASEAEFFDNSSARKPFRRVAHFRSNALINTAEWPTWAPLALLGLA